MNANSKREYLTLKETERDGQQSRKGLDPFTQTLHLTSMDILKVIINTMWLLPLRLLLITIVVCIGIAISAIAAVDDTTRPLQGWRKFLVHRVGVALNRVLIFGIGFHRIRTIGSPAPSTIAPIRVIAPHSSFFDLLLCCLDCVPTSVAKADARNVPIFGRLIDQTLKTIFVSRMDNQSRQDCYNEIIRRVDSPYDWPPVLIYPEGTTTNRKCLVRFKHGAFKPQVAVQPIIIRYRNKLNTMVWTENGVGSVMSLYLTVCQFDNSVEIEYLPVYHPSEEEKENSQLFAENVQSLMAQSLRIPATLHTLEDIFLGREAKSLHLPFWSGVIEYGALTKLHSVTFEQVKKFIRRFSLIDVDKDGFISKEDVVRFMRLTNNSNHVVIVNEMYEEMNQANNNTITFREYVFGLLRQSKGLASNDELMQNIFNCLDSDSDGLLTRQDLLKVLSPLSSSSSVPDRCYESSRGSSWRGYNVNCCCKRERRDEETGECEIVHFLDFPGPWNNGQFQSLLNENLDYLILFNKLLQQQMISDSSSPISDEIELL